MHAVVLRRIDRLRLSMLHHLPARMETSVSWVNEELVRHTTRIRALGICCMDSEESFHLHENGNQFTVAISQRFAPTFWLKRVFPEGRGECRMRRRNLPSAVDRRNDLSTYEGIR